MKVIGIVGSPRMNGNTEIATAHALKAIAEEGLETELIRLAKLDIKPCNACMACQKVEKCSIDDDLFPVYLKMKEADGIIMATPVYFGAATALVRAAMERTGYISRWNGSIFEGKVGAPLVVARRAGHVFTSAELTLWFQGLGFIMPGSRSIASGRDKGDVVNDKEGMEMIWNMGKHMASLLKKVR